MTAEAPLSNASARARPTRAGDRQADEVASDHHHRAAESTRMTKSTSPRNASKSDPPPPPTRLTKSAFPVTPPRPHNSAPTPISHRGAQTPSSSQRRAEHRTAPEDDLVAQVDQELNELKLKEKDSRESEPEQKHEALPGRRDESNPARLTSSRNVASSSTSRSGLIDGASPVSDPVAPRTTPSSGRTSSSKAAASTTPASSEPGMLMPGVARSPSASRANPSRPENYMARQQSSSGSRQTHTSRPGNHFHVASKYDPPPGGAVHPGFFQQSVPTHYAAQPYPVFAGAGYHPAYIQNSLSPQPTYVLDASGQYRLANPMPAPVPSPYPSPYYDMSGYAQQFSATSPVHASPPSQLYSPGSTSSFLHPAPHERQLSSENEAMYGQLPSDGRSGPSPEMIAAMAQAHAVPTSPVLYSQALGLYDVGQSGAAYAPHQQPPQHQAPSMHARQPSRQQGEFSSYTQDPQYAQYPIMHTPSSPYSPQVAHFYPMPPQASSYGVAYAGRPQYVQAPPQPQPQFAFPADRRGQGNPQTMYWPEAAMPYQMSVGASRAQEPPGSPMLAAAYAQQHRPQVYMPPNELARGQLAQSKLHDAIFARDTRYPDQPRRRGPDGLNRGSALPKPPAHSPHALWVGNVPSDATHAELWRFFTSRPAPMASPAYADVQAEDGVDLRSTGVESIHLIARSNCAFVNYSSDIHLQHAISVSHGLPLRPHDARCKDLVCRVRKKEDDSKSGVGAQRTGGMHHAFVAARDREEKEVAAAAKRLAKAEQLGGGEESGTGSEPHAKSFSSGHTTSLSSTSTTSSFLAKHFKKRYFILKSHDENDLQLSVERGLWATQSHNEPILQQAYLTSQDVYLIFGANKSGCFFGYARMASTITNDPEKQVSWSSREQSPAVTSSSDSKDSSKDSKDSKDSRDSRDSKLGSVRVSAILEEDEDEGAAADDEAILAEPVALAAPRIFSPSEQRWLDKSPMQLSPGGRVVSESAPTTLTTAAKVAFSIGTSSLDPTKLRLPRSDGVDEEPKSVSVPEGFHRAVLEQQLLGSSDAPAALGEDGVWRKDTIVTPEERNNRLEKLEEIDIAKPAPPPHEDSLGWGRPFSVEWIKVGPLPFSRCKHIRNEFNANREVKISRDGTEVEPSAGAALIAEFWKDPVSPNLSTQSAPDDDGDVDGSRAQGQSAMPSGMVVGSP